MQFTASSAELLKALSVAAGAVPSKSTLPILECILFEREGDRLRLSATDLEISIIQLVGVRFDGAASPERVAIPARRLLDTLRALPDLPVHIETDREHNVMLRTDQGRFKMVGFDGADYPALPQLAGGARIETTGQILRRAVQKTSFAVSKDALRPAMMGIYFQVGPEHARAVATDGHRLVRLRLEEIKAEEPLAFIVPEKALTLAARVATHDACTVAVEGSYVGFDFGASKVLARVIDESYPNYEAVIPADNERRMVINGAAMLAAVKRVSLYSSNLTNQIRLSVSQNQVEVSAEDIERASEARETIVCEYADEPMVIGFNHKYLEEVLGNVDSEDVVFEFSSPNRAGVVTPADESADEELMMLIMPVMLNTYA